MDSMTNWGLLFLNNYEVSNPRERRYFRSQESFGAAERDATREKLGKFEKLQSNPEL